MRERFKSDMHFESTRPSEHEGYHQTERAFRAYATLEARGTSPNRPCIPSVHNPRSVRDSLKPNVHVEGTRHSGHAGYTRSANAFRGHATLGACRIASNRACTPRVHDPRSARESLKVRMHSEGTQPSELAGYPLTGRAFRGYTTLGA